MQSRAWVTRILFSKWLYHFIHHFNARRKNFSTNKHLLILDAHNLHVTIDVVEMTIETIGFTNFAKSHLTCASAFGCFNF